MAATCTVTTEKISRTQIIQTLAWDTTGDSSDPITININSLLGGPDASIIKVITIPGTVTNGYDLLIEDALGNSIVSLTNLSSSTTETHRLETGAARLYTIGGTGHTLTLTDHGGADKSADVVLWLSY